VQLKIAFNAVAFKPKVQVKRDLQTGVEVDTNVAHELVRPLQGVRVEIVIDFLVAHSESSVRLPVSRPC